MDDRCIARHIGQSFDLLCAFGQKIFHGRAIAMGQNIDWVTCRQEVLCNTVSHKANAYKSDRLCCVIHDLSLLRCCRDSLSVLKLRAVFGEFGVKIGALVKSQPFGAGGLPAAVIASYTAALRSNLFRR